jgi:hypothetical protein
MFKKSVVLMALLAGTFAADTIRNRLGQMNSKNLAQNTAGDAIEAAGDDWCGCEGSLTDLPEVELPECPCNFSELPGLGAGLENGGEERVVALRGEYLKSSPDTQYSQICQSNCCSCEEEAHAAYTNARKNRTFTISGSISVLETLRVQEQGKARENSQGYSEKDTICQTNNAEGDLGAGACGGLQAATCDLGTIQKGVQGKQLGAALQ